MVDYINNIGVNSTTGNGQVLPDTAISEDGLVQESLEMTSSYSSSVSGIDTQINYQLLKLEVNGQRYTGIPDIFQSRDPAIQAVFDQLRGEGVITEDMSLADQQQIMGYLGTLAKDVSNNASINSATAFNGTSDVAVTTFIAPQDPAVTTLAAQLVAAGVITASMTDEEIMAAINTYVNSNYSYQADVSGEGWSTASATIASGSGDCEDLAILAANLAIACGVDQSSVQVCVAGGTQGNQGHVVVGLTGASGQLTTFDPVTGQQSTASTSDFTFTFNSTTVTSGNGSVGNSWVMEDATSASSLYTASGTTTPSIGTVRSTIATSINTTYFDMLAYAGNLSTYTDPGALFTLQQELQTKKDMIATFTAVGKMIGDTLSEAMQGFAKALNN